MLLVHDQEAQLAEPHPVGQQPVGPDHDVHLPALEAVHHPACLGGGEEAAQHLDPEGVGGEAFREGLEMLLDEQRGGTQHGNLVPVRHRLEGGPQGDLGLSEAYVAEDEAVHGERGLHVPLDVLDSGQLVGRLLEGEGGLDLALPGSVGGERMALGRGPGPVDRHHVVG